MSLRDIVKDARAACLTDAKTQIEAVEKIAVPLVKADPDALDQAIRRAIREESKAQATRYVRDPAEKSSSQGGLFDRLPAEVPLGLDSRTLKQTASLTEIEVRHQIAVREKGIRADQAALDVWLNALSICTPIWLEHPDWTFGECLREHDRQQAAA